tara:strand:- start:1780 stop:2745 length:966 start_codon:yes stop_codon:yes gene_type:complete
MADEEEVVSTDQEIMDNIGEGNESTTSESTEEEVTGEDTDVTGETSTASSEQGTESGDSTQQQQSAGGPQDLRDAQGNVVAAGGKERRFYETAQRERTRADTAERDKLSLQGQLDAINKAGSVSTQYNLTPEEVTTGAQLISAWKKNPVETLQYMLTQAQASGHNVDAISSGGTDMSAVKQMLDTALKPFTDERQSRVDTQTANDQAKQVFDSFNTKYPDSAAHHNSLARLITKDPTLTPEAAYLTLRNYYLEKGLDWTKSLEVLQQEHTASQTSAQNTQQQLPDGNVSSGNVRDTESVADINTSSDDIIRQAMAEAGYTT